MAIKVQGTTIIDNSRNLSNIGIMTVGSGSSSVILNSNSILNVGTGVTFDGNTGVIALTGTFIAKGGLSLPLNLA
jgi:hypothetical protein